MPMQPGSPQAQMPAAEDALIRRIQEIERVQREMLPSVAASFGPVMTDLAAKDVTILGLIDDLAAQDAILTAQQATLAAQVADIAALVGAQVAMGGGNADQTNITLTTADAPYAVVTVAVPAGFTRAGVLCTAAWMARYPASGGGYLYLKPSIGGGSGLERQVFVPASTTGAFTAGFYQFMTGLSGSFTAAATARYSVALPDPAFTNATVSVMAVFLR